MIRGMDISGYQELLDEGAVYYDEFGNEVDSLEYAVERGFNYARLRIWNEPQNMPDSKGYCDILQTIAIAKKIKKQGIGLFLDFHYSDWWADPGQQRKPKAWEHLSVDALEQAVYDYTKDTLMRMDEEAVYPDMIQIGNEIRTGMLFPEGAVPNWENLARFINAGIRAVRDTQKNRDTKIVLHLDQGGKYEYFREWFDHVMACSVTDFDIIGLSYYPFWHGTYAMFKQNMDALVERYGKEIIVAETAHAFRKSGGSFFREAQEQAAGFTATPENQRKVLELIISIIGHVKDGKGLGFFYWEPFTKAPEDAAGWGVCMGLMDEKGRPTEGYKAVTYQPKPEADKQIAKVYCPAQMEFTMQDCGGDSNELVGLLPKQLTVLFWDGHTEEYPVVWKPAAVKKGCRYRMEGILLDLPKEWQTVSLAVRVKDAGDNLLKNGDFAQGMQGYDIRTQEAIVSVTADETGFHYQAVQNFELHLETAVEVKEPGAYQATIVYRGGNTTGTRLLFYTDVEGHRQEAALFPKEQEYSIESISVEVNFPGRIQVGIDMAAPTVSGTIREIRFERLCMEQGH